MALLLLFTFNACSSDSSEEVLSEKEEPEVPPEKYENDIHLMLRLKLKI